LYTRYEKNDKQYKIINDWATNHKTIIVKNGGATQNLIQMVDLFKELNYPWTTFSEPDLDNALTCVGIVVPERLYNREIYNRFCEAWRRSAAESEFIKLLEQTQLAR
jgi:hypothetical protein